MPDGSINTNVSTWRLGDVEGATSGERTRLRHVVENAELVVENGRLAAGKGYAEASLEARHSLARTGAILRLRHRGRFYVHASAVVDVAGRACVFVGESGSGKSTLAFALVRRGWRLLGDDGVILEPVRNTTIVHGWRAPLLVSADLESHFPEMRSQASNAIRGDLRRRVPFCAESLGHATLGKLVFVMQSPVGFLRPCSQTVALPLLMRQSPWVLLGDATSALHFNALHRVVSTNQTFEFGHGPAELQRMTELFESAA